jgi:hypothetical protein
MRRVIFAIVSATAVFSASPAVAATAQQKLETCTFGADDQKLTGAPRKKFMSNCMATRDSPRGKPAPAAKRQ